jgi:hypothetical protein
MKILLCLVPSEAVKWHRIMKSKRTILMWKFVSRRSMKSLDQVLDFEITWFMI